MARILVVYGTTEGQTKKISETVAGWLRDKGLETESVHSGDLPSYLDVGSYDAFVVAGSLHQGEHQKSIVQFVRENLSVIQAKPSAFLSVSLTAALNDDEHQAEARHCIMRFLEETGWTPTASTPVAGALMYLEYDYFKRLVLKMIAKQQGGSTDTSKNHEYTDWRKLQQFIDEFVTGNVDGHPTAKAVPQPAES